MWVVNGDTVEKLIVFNGKYDEDPSIFSGEQKVPEDKTSSPVQIHRDDSIYQVKKKIVNELGCNYAELYLVCRKTRKINLLNAIMSSTKSVIDDALFKQFSKNMDLAGLSQSLCDIKTKDIERNVYSYEYLSSLGFNKECKLDIKTGLGIDFGKNYLLSPNPFDIELNYDNMDIKKIYANDNEILGDVCDNDIYVCLAKDVFQYTESKGMMGESISKLYFPNLFSDRVFNLENLGSAQESLRQKTSKIMKEEYFSLYKEIDTLHEIYYDRDSEMIATKGINEFSIEIVPPYKVVMPLDTIFKNIHCSKEYPFIKYAPGKRRETMYRLYSVSVLKTGKKKPFLSENKIKSLRTTTPNNQQISIYYNSVYNTIIGIKPDGVIRISVQFEKDVVKTVSEIETILKMAVNPVLDRINSYLVSSGYRISVVESLRDENVKIVNMNYHFSTVVSKRISLKNTCIYSIFDVIKSNIYSKTGAYLRFKRIDNFQKENQLNAFINDMFKKRGLQSDAYSALASQYGIELNQAKLIVLDYLENVNLSEKNPGLKTTITAEKISNDLHVKEDIIHMVFENLENIDYIESLDIYCESIIRLVQGKHTSSDVSQICVPNREMVYEAVVEDVPVLEKEAEKEKEKDINEILNDKIREIVQEEPKKEVKVAFGMFDSDDESDEDDDDDDDKMVGGNSDDEEEEDEPQKKGKIFFTKRLKKYDPGLFRDIGKKNAIGETMVFEQANKNKNMTSYTKTCPPMQQPVVISDKEKEHIDKHYPGSYDKKHTFKYGSTEKTQNWYVCPRFWCFKTNTTMTEDDIMNGKCGIKSIENNPNVFEFNDKKDHPSKYNKGEFFSPSFTKQIHSDKNICMPCCYAEWDSKMHQKRRAKCLKENEEYEATKSLDEDVQEEMKIQAEMKPQGEMKIQPETKTPPGKSDNIMAPSSKLTHGRWGYLPPSVEQFLQIKKKSVSDKNPYNFLRYGVDQSNKSQSFVGCLADVYKRDRERKRQPAIEPTIENMRRVIVDSITLDNYVKYGNGSFVKLFLQDSHANQLENSANQPIDNHRETKTYKSFMKNNKKDQLQDIVNSYHNFCNYLLDDQSEIDHTYLWDVFTTPNPKLFERGINLVIMEQPNDDITDKVDLICPTTSYLNNRFDKKRPTVFLISSIDRQDATAIQTFEPVYLAHFTEKKKKKAGEVENMAENKKKYTIDQAFHAFDLENSKKTIPNIYNVINIIDKTLNKYCSSNREIPKEYYQKFERPIELATLVSEIKKTNNYEIVKQVLNYQNQVIALMVNTPSNNELFVPCEPSAPLEYESVFMDEPKLWLNYKTTSEELAYLHSANDKIPCQPILKVFESGLVVGFVTKTNQFVKLNEPARNENDGIGAVSEQNYILNNQKQIPSVISMAIEKEKTGDDLRSKTMRNILLENDFFILFRSTVKSLLENRENKERVMAVYNDKTTTYKDKLKSMVEVIRSISESAVEYEDFSEKSLNELSKAQFQCKKNTTSGFYKDGCKLIIPRQSLVSTPVQYPNSRIYPFRIADEIIRYGRIQNYILNSNQFLNMGDTEFSVNADEYIVMDSLLMSDDYFENTETFKTTAHSSGIPYSMATTKTYEKRLVQLAEQQPAKIPVAVSHLKDCYDERDYLKAANKNYWANEVFPNGKKTQVLQFNNTNEECKFGPLIYIMEKYRPGNYNSTIIRDMLWKAYEPFFKDEKMKKKILSILDKQGKRKLLRGVVLSEDFKLIVKNGAYFLTSMDLWVFAETYRVPILLFSSSESIHDFFWIQTNNMIDGKKHDDEYVVDENPNTKYNYSWMILGRDDTDDFFFYDASRRAYSKAELEENIIPEHVVLESPLNIRELRYFYEEVARRPPVSIQTHLAKLLKKSKQ